MPTRVLGDQPSALFLFKAKADLESAWEQNRPTRAFGLRESGEPLRKAGGRPWVYGASGGVLVQAEDARIETWREDPNGVGPLAAIASKGHSNARPHWECVARIA